MSAARAAGIGGKLRSSMRQQPLPSSSSMRQQPPGLPSSLAVQRGFEGSPSGKATAAGQTRQRYLRRCAALVCSLRIGEAEQPRGQGFLGIVLGTRSTAPRGAGKLPANAEAGAAPGRPRQGLRPLAALLQGKGPPPHPGRAVAMVDGPPFPTGPASCIRGSRPLSPATSLAEKEHFEQQ